MRFLSGPVGKIIAGIVVWTLFLLAAFEQRFGQHRAEMSELQEQNAVIQKQMALQVSQLNRLVADKEESTTNPPASVAEASAAIAAHREETKAFQLRHGEETKALATRYEEQQKEFATRHVEQQKEFATRHEEQHKELAAQVEDLRAETTSPPMAKRRKLGNGIYSIAAAGSNAVGTGCISFTAATNFDMSSATCSNSKKCNPCFIFIGTADVTINIRKCSTTRYKQGSTAPTSMSNVGEVAEYTFINAAASKTLTIQAQDSTPSDTNVYYLPGLKSVIAHCYAGGSDKLFFPDGAYGAVDFCPPGCDAATPVKLASAAAGTNFVYRGVDSAPGTTILRTNAAGSTVQAVTAFPTCDGAEGSLSDICQNADLTGSTKTSVVGTLNPVTANIR